MNTLSEIKNTLEGIKSRLDKADDQICHLENKVGKKHTISATKSKKT